MLLVLLLYISISELDAECRYAFIGTNDRPVKMDECSDLSWGIIVHSMSRHCYQNGGNITYKLYYEEDCPSDESKWHDQDTDIPCYIDKSIDCESFQIHTYMMTYNPSISNEYYRPPIRNDTDSWEPDTNPDETCYYDSSEEFYGSHPIYDACLANPTSTEHPYIKGEYFKGAFETNCSYKIHYYSDSKCRNKIDTSYTYNAQCREGTDGVPYSYDFPDCPWRPNTVWVVVFCVLGCCCCGCCAYWLKSKKRRGKACFCCYEWYSGRYGHGYYVRKEGHCCWICCEYQERKKREREERKRRREHEEWQQRERERKLKKVEEEKKRKMMEEEIDEIELQKQRNRKEREQRELEERGKRRDDMEMVVMSKSGDDGEKVKTVKDVELIDRKGTLSYSAAQCVICLDVLLENEESRLVCGHKFHTHCIQDYNETKSECPLCRKPIVFSQN